MIKLNSGHSRAAEASAAQTAGLFPDGERAPLLVYASRPVAELAHVSRIYLPAMSSNAPISLANYRTQKAERRLERRLANARTIFDSTGKCETVLWLTYLAIIDYLNEVLPLRGLRREQKCKIINRALLDVRRSSVG